jgi:hypothetical protein
LEVPSGFILSRVFASRKPVGILLSISTIYFFDVSFPDFLPESGQGGVQSDFGKPYAAAREIFFMERPARLAAT